MDHNGSKYEKLRAKIYSIAKDYSHEILEPKYGTPLNQAQILEKLANFPQIEKHALIIVNDQDRSTPTPIIIQALRTLHKLSTPVHFLIASGTHHPLSNQEARNCSGAETQDLISIHDAKRDIDLEYIGSTSHGTRVSVNKAIRLGPQIITINSVEPHYFAGFTGGVKSIIPGIASYETIVANHAWAMDPQSNICHMHGNPVFDDLWEAGNLVCNLKTVLSIQMINHGNNIYHISWGPLPSAFEEAKKIASQIYCWKSLPFFDHIISFVEPPLDKTLYQAQKAIENIRGGLRVGGTFILIASCNNGIGSDNFYRTICRLKTPQMIVNSLKRETYQFGDHKAFDWARFVSQHTLYYLGSLDDEIVKKMFMVKISEEQLIEYIHEWSKREEKVLIDLAGGYSAIELHDS